MRGLNTILFFTIVLPLEFAISKTNNCDLLRIQIKDILTQKTLPVQKSERDILNALSPKVNKEDLQVLKKELDDTYYDENKLVVMKERLDYLEKIKKSTPTEEEVIRHHDLKNKSDRTDEENVELVTLMNKIDSQVEALSVEQENEYVELNLKIKDLEKRMQKFAQSELNLNNYLKNKVQEKVLEYPLINLYGLKFYEVTSDQVQMNIEKDLLDQKKIFSHFLGRESYSFEMDDLINRIDDRSYKVISDGNTFDVSLNFIDAEHDLNNALREIIIIGPNKLVDFLADDQKNNKLDLSKINIYGDVKTSLDLLTGEFKVLFKTKIKDENKKLRSFPEDYLSLTEMTELLLPKDCRDEDNNPIENFNFNNSREKGKELLETKTGDVSKEVSGQ